LCSKKANFVTAVRIPLKRYVDVAQLFEFLDIEKLGVGGGIWSTVNFSAFRVGKKFCHWKKKSPNYREIFDIEKFEKLDDVDSVEFFKKCHVLQKCRFSPSYLKFVITFLFFTLSFRLGSEEATSLNQSDLWQRNNRCPKRVNHYTASHNFVSSFCRAFAVPSDPPRSSVNSCRQPYLR